MELALRIHEVGAPIWLIVVHGLGEHKDRHDHFFRNFGEDFNIVTFDLRGHGESDGKRATVDLFDHFIDDLNSLVEFLQKNYNLQQYILFGHSMGGLISTRFVQQEPILKPKLLFLSSPALGVTGVIKNALKVLPNSFVTKLASFNRGIYLKGVLDLKKLSHNFSTYEDYLKDPLCSLKINTKLLFKIIEEANNAQEQVFQIDIPMYGVIGSKDVLVDPLACQDFFKASGRLKELKLIKGGYHELHNELSEFRDPYINFLKRTLLSYRYHENL